MKKILSLLVMAIVAIQFSFAGDVITKDMNQPSFYQTSGGSYQD